MFHFSFPWLLLVKRQQPLSCDTETCVFETVGTADIVLMSTRLTRRSSVCMHYWLALYWLLLPQLCSIDRRLRAVNRAANSSCLWLFFLFCFVFSFSFSVAATDVKGWLSRLCVLGSLAGSQAERSLCSESLRSGRGDKVEERLSGHCGPALMQLTTATDAGAMYPWSRNVFAHVGMWVWINHPLPAHYRSVWTHTRVSMRSNNNHVLLMCGTKLSLIHLQHHRIVWSDKWVSGG